MSKETSEACQDDEAALLDFDCDTVDSTAVVFAAEADGTAVKVAQALREDCSTVIAVAAWVVGLGQPH